MISVLKRTVRLMRLLFIAGLLLGIPLATNVQHAAAAPMQEHKSSSDMQSNCAEYCALTNNNALPRETVLAPEENRAPEPIPTSEEVYGVDSGAIKAPRVLRSSTYDSYLIRPPDIIKTHCKYRI
jgi:hypothetical protein